MDCYTLIFFIGYLLAMIAIGIFFSDKSSDLSSFYLGGRKMNKWVVALSAQASDMSGWLLMGLPGAIFLCGVSEAWIGVGLAIGTYLNWKIIAQRLRIYSHACNNAITIPDFLSNRFLDKSGILRLISAAVILFFFMIYTASGFVSCAKLFNSTFGIDYKLGLFIGVLLIVSYTLLGGYMAVCWTDLIQGAIMFFAIAAVPLVMVINGGGFEKTVDSVNQISPHLLNIFSNASTGASISLIGLISSLAWALGYFGMPHILVRFMSINHASEIKDSRRIAMTWVIVSLAAASAVGILGRILFVGDAMLADPERVFMEMVKVLFHPIFLGVVMSAVLAAIMSTADSQLLVAASAFSNDLYKRLIHKSASEKELILVSRLTVAAVAVVAAGIVFKGENTPFVTQVMKLVSFAWGGFGAAFGPVIILALFWKRFTLIGAASAMVVGAVTTILWKFFLPGWVPCAAKLWGIYEIVPGFILAFITAIVASYCSKPPTKEITDTFDAVEAESMAVHIHGNHAQCEGRRLFAEAYQDKAKHLSKN